MISDLTGPKVKKNVPRYGIFAYIDLPYKSTKCRQIYHIYMDPMGMYQIFVYSKSGLPKINRMSFCLIQTKKKVGRFCWVFVTV